MNQADTAFDCNTPGGPTEEEAKEVYAQFGSSYYYGEVLHRGLCNLYQMVKMPQTGKTWPRADELLKEAWSLTLGSLVTRLEPHLPVELIVRLQVAVKRRNFLAHHFWYERIHLMASSRGTHEAVGELSEIREEFRALDAEIEVYAMANLSKLPVPMAEVEKAFAEEMALIRTGIPPEPLIDQRPPRRRENIVDVYTIPPNGSLVFVADDRTLWQLCEVGLGWTAHEKIGDDWEMSARFSELLPAMVPSRPPVKANWNFEIPFGRRATLVVRPGTPPVVYRWQIKRSA